MTDLTFTLLRLGFLVLLWVFVLSAIGVLRRDLYGTKTAPRRRRGEVHVPPVTSPSPQVPEPARPASGTIPRQPSRQAARQAAQPGAPTRLVVTAGPLRNTTLPLTTSSILIGRAPSCTLVLDDDYSSSRHARIFPQNGAWYLEDLGSTNGTYVGEQRISGIIPLQPGMAVRIGQSAVELQR